MNFNGVGAGLFIWLVYIGGFLIIIRLIVRALVLGAKKILGME